jgi:hypothetical protein
MAAHQVVAEEPEASMLSEFVGLSTSESLGSTADRELRAIMKLSRNGTRVVTFSPLPGVPFVLFRASYKGIVSG